MQIANSLITTPQAISENNPSQQSAEVDGLNPVAKKAGKKPVAGSEGAEGFDAALLALSAQQAPVVVDTQKPVVSAEAVQLAAKAAAQAQAKSTEQQNATSKQLPVYPNVAQVLDMKQTQMANGSITGAFTAGPNNPWNSRWVFGGQTPQTDPKQGELDLSALQKLGQLSSKKGSENAESRIAQLEQLGALDEELAKVQGQLEALSLEEVSGEGESVRAKPQLKSLSGGEYLALQNLKDASQGQPQQQSGGSFGDSQREPLQRMVKPNIENTGSIKTKEFQLIPGGLSLKDKESSSVSDLTMGTAPTTWMNQNHQTHRPQAVELTGHVVPGAMMRDRLTSESVQNLSSGINNLKLAQGGEMKIKLNPGHLGELMIKVSTDGHAVGLKVQASDPKAKKILEDSMSSLKESLATQQLALNRVDISVAPANQSQQSQMDMNSQNSNSGYRSDMQQQYDSRENGNQRQSYASAQDGYDSPRVNRSFAASSNPVRPSRVASEGRVDLMA